LGAESLARLRAEGRAKPIKDSLIAVPALAHEMAGVTLDKRAFDAAVAMHLDCSPGRSLVRPAERWLPVG
jgi:predicted nucleic acid-binding protein